jgi:1-deoxy-D-xylulose-5-phosphate reductoisomerase
MNTSKGLAVLGCTGSVGINTLDVVASHPEKFDVVALAAHSNLDVLEQQARRFRPRLAVLFDEEKAGLLRQRLHGLNIEVGTGLEGICQAATYNGVHLVMSAVVGSIGLLPTIHAVQAGIDVALANKETLVMAGELVIRADKPEWGRVIPVDSEHNAIVDCLWWPFPRMATQSHATYQRCRSPQPPKLENGSKNYHRLGDHDE